MTPRVYVLLPVHNRKAVTEELIRCLVTPRWRNFHLVLLDDGSTDGTAEMVLRHLPDSTICRGDGRWWWAGSLQQGLLWLRRSPVRPEDIVLILNDDTTFESIFLEAGVKALDKKQRTLLLAQLYSAEDGSFLEVGVHADWTALSFTGAKDPALVNCFSTRGLFLRMADILEIGGFHPLLLPHYASDYEYTIRARRKGFTLMTSPEVRLWLKERTTGIRSIPRQPLWPFLRTIFSTRAVQNPMYWTSFVLLACPLRYVPVNLYRVWSGFLRQAVATADA